MACFAAALHDRLTHARSGSRMILGVRMLGARTAAGSFGQPEGRLKMCTRCQLREGAVASQDVQRQKGTDARSTRVATHPPSAPRLTYRGRGRRAPGTYAGRRDAAHVLRDACEVHARCMAARRRCLLFAPVFDEGEPVNRLMLDAYCPI